MNDMAAKMAGTYPLLRWLGYPVSGISKWEGLAMGVAAL
jgi:hypothetical protein